MSSSEPVGSGPRQPLPTAGSIPGNSHKARTEPPKPAETQAEREKVEKVVQGKVVTRKQPWYKRAAGSLVADDAQTVGDYVLSDVIIPAVKNLIADIINQGTNRALYGTARARPGGGIVGRGGVGTSLRNQYHDRPSIGEQPRALSRESRARHNFDDIVLETRDEAITVIESLVQQIGRYGSATVADLYDFLGVTGSFADRSWGWTDLVTADIRQTRGGFLLDLPRPEPIR